MATGWPCLRRLSVAAKGPVITLRAGNAATVRSILELRTGNCIFRAYCCISAPSRQFFTTFSFCFISYLLTKLLYFRIITSRQRWTIMKAVRSVGASSATQSHRRDEEMPITLRTNPQTQSFRRITPVPHNQAPKPPSPFPTIFTTRPPLSQIPPPHNRASISPSIPTLKRQVPRHPSIPLKLSYPRSQKPSRRP